jgi:hypothetical protein
MTTHTLNEMPSNLLCVPRSSWKHRHWHRKSPPEALQAAGIAFTPMTRPTQHIPLLLHLAAVTQAITLLIHGTSNRFCK